MRWKRARTGSSHDARRLFEKTKLDEPRAEREKYKSKLLLWVFLLSSLLRATHQDSRCSHLTEQRHSLRAGTRYSFMRTGRGWVNVMVVCCSISFWSPQTDSVELEFHSLLLRVGIFWCSNRMTQFTLRKSFVIKNLSSSFFQLNPSNVLCEIIF